MIVLLVRTDGRDSLLAQTIASAKENLRGPITRRIMHTDAGESHVRSLAIRWPHWEVVGGERLGFGGAIDRAWKYIAETGAEPFVFDIEDDFTFNKPVPLHGMMRVLEAHPYLAQLVLLRQPWNEEEKKAGGIVEMWPDQYTEREWEGYKWLEHQLFWSTNPSLYYADRCVNGWPTMDQSEAAYSKLVFTDPTTRCAYWGARDSGEWVHHCGDQRVGRSY